MLKSLQEDLYRYEGERSKRWWMPLRYFLFTPGFQYMYFLRHAQSSKFKLFWLILLKLCSFKFGIQIPYQTQIGRGFRISHWGTIVVNPAASIGDNCTICQGCLIGNAEGKKKGVPTIGNNVNMNANSIIIGGVHIGNDVLIAPGAFVNFDVPDNSVVIGNPGVIKTYDSSPTQKYIVFSV